MSYNLRLVEHFLSTQYRYDKTKLKSVVTKNFVCHSPFMKPKNFAQYVKFAQSFSPNRSVVVDEIYSSNDTEFLVKYTVSVSSPREDDVRLQTGVLNIAVKNELISQLVFNDYVNVDSSSSRNQFSERYRQ